jgi:SAM-dependent methyltransferase
MSVNADPAELEKFGRLASRWWDPQGEFRPLHEINPLRLGWIEGHVPLAGKNVLDVGCGGGILTEAMARSGARVTGIDLSEKALRVAELHLLESKLDIRYEKSSVEDYRGTFDVVTCMELIEHVPDQDLWLPLARGSSVPAGTFSFRPSTAISSPTSSPWSARNTCSASSQGHARLPAFREAFRARRLVPRERPELRGADRHDLQPAHAALQPRA